MWWTRRNGQRETALRNDTHSFFRGGGLLLIAQGVAVLSGLFVHIAAAHCLVPGEYSDFAAVVLVAIGFQRLFLGGVPFVLRRHLSIAPDSVRPATRRAICLQLPFSAGAFALLALAALFTALIGCGGGLPVALFLTGIEVLVRTATFDLGIQALNGLRAFGRQFFVASAYHLSRFVFVVACLVGGYGLAGAILALIAASLVGGSLALAFLMNAGSNAESAPGLSRRKWWSRVRVGLPFELLGFILYASNLWIVTLIIADELSVAVYAACFMIARVTLAVGVALGGSVFSHVAQLIAEGKSETARLFVSGVFNLMVVLFATTVVFTYHFGGILLRIVFSAVSSDGTQLFCIVMAGMSCITSALFFGEILGAIGALRARLIVVIVVNAIGVPATFATVGAGGVWAGAWSLLAVGLVSAVGFSYSLTKQLGAVITLRTVLYGTIGTGLAAVLFGFLKSLSS